MSQRDKAPTMRALLPSRLVPEDMLSEWQGPNLPNTKNYAPSEDSMRGRMGNVLMQGIAALGGFTGLPMGGEESKAALLGELLAAGMPLVGGVKALRGLAGAKKLPYKAARESLRDVADANFGYGIPVGNRTVNIETLRGGMSAASDDAAKVNKIAQQMSSKDGYIERLIVDQNGNVIEGQHRLRALQSLGVQDVPVSVIQDYSDVVETLQKQGMRPEHARQVTQQTHDMLKDSGSAAKVRSDYNLSGQYEAQFESALDLIDAPKAKQGIKAYHGSAEIARRGKLDKFQREISPTGSIRVPDENADAMGTWWSASKEDAKKFGKNFGPDGVLRDGAVVEGEIRFKNPKVFDNAEDYTAFIRKFKREDGMGGFKMPRSDDMRTALDGHDGIIIRGGGKGDRTPEGADYYLAFNNEDFDVKKVDLPDWSKPPSR